MKADDRRKSLQQIPYGLFIVGAPQEEGGWVAIVATWVMQLSFDPPLVGVSIERGSALDRAIGTAGCFSVNMLPSGTTSVARAFLKAPVVFGSDFGGNSFSPAAMGSPFLQGAASSIECRVVKALESGDHTLYIGEVIDAVAQKPGDVLTQRETGWSYWKEPKGGSRQN